MSINNTSKIVNINSEKDDSKQEYTQSDILFVPEISFSVPSNYSFHNRRIMKNHIVKHLKKGNIKPIGNYEETPKNMKINLKLHQKRMLYEMLVKENLDHRVSSDINCFCIADKVGSGKSIEILSLICKKPYVNKIANNKIIYKNGQYKHFSGLTLNPTIELKTNLIVVPHGIYNQWKKYIEDSTNLKYIGISKKKDIENLNIKSLNNKDTPPIMIIKSTRYNDLMRKIYKNYPSDIRLDLNSEKNIIQDLKNKIWNSKSYRSDSNTFLNEVMKIKEYLNNLDLEKIKEEFKNKIYYSLTSIFKYSGPIFERVIFDEANSIKIPACLSGMGKFNWFVTSSLEDLLYPCGDKSWCRYSKKIKVNANGISGTGFIKKIFKFNSFDQLGNWNHILDMYLKNNDDFVKTSFKLPEPVFHKILCYTPPEIAALKNITMPDVMKALNAGDISTAIELVGCPIKNQSSISDMVLTQLQNKFKKLETKLKSKQNLITSINEEIDNNEDGLSEDTLVIKKNLIKNLKISIKRLETQKKEIEFKIKSLSERISNIEEKCCPICSDTVSDACLTPCCKNVFCFSCAATAIKYCPKCPLCRSVISLPSLTIISDKAIKEEKKDDLPKKMEFLIKKILDKPKGKFLVFSEFENTFNCITQNLVENGITFSRLNGSTGRVTNIINDFSNNKIQVLLLNAQYYGSGLNLEMSTDIILYHRMSSDLENQIIGRGQRPGRKDKLEVTYLCYSNEFT